MRALGLFDLVFYLVAAAVVSFAAYAVLSRNLVRAVFALLGTFFGVAILYGMLAADFVAVVQVMVYVGGILILLLFAVMLTSQIATVARSNRSGSWLLGVLAGASLLCLLLAVVLKTPWRVAPYLPVSEPTTALIGQKLGGVFALPVIVTGVTLLGCVIGAVTIARRSRHKEDGQ